MTKSRVYEKYEILFKSLKKIIIESENRIRDDDSDPLFITNVNFFVKLYLICICTYLETYLQDIVYDYIEIIKMKLSSVSIPRNLVLWEVQKDVKEKDFIYKSFKIDLRKRDLTNQLTCNPYKTIKTFKLIGIDLTKDKAFNSNKDIIASIVEKRNNIVHHNDSAMDISMNDLLCNIDSVLLYMESIDSILLKRDFGL